MATSQDFVNWVCAAGVDPQFLKYLFIAEGDRLLRFASGAVHQTIYFPEVKAFHICLPPLREQKRIVEILDQALETTNATKERAQKNMRNANELLPSILQSAFEREQKATTHRFALEQLTQQDSPITYGVVKPGAEGEVSFVRGGDINEGQIRIEELRTITRIVSQQYKRTLLRGGEILMCLVGQPGQVAVVPPTLVNANIARQVGLIRLKSDVNAQFVRYFLQSPIGQRSLGAKTSGSVQQVINLRELRNIHVPLPTRTKQDALVRQLDELTEESCRLRRLCGSKIEAVVALNASVLARAFLGRL